MKKKLSCISAIVLAVFLAFDARMSHAQPPTPPSTPPAPGVVSAPAPGGPPMPRPPRRPPAPGMVFQRTIMSLKQAKAQLQRAESDLGGHKQTAIDACAKAIEELDAALKALPPAPQPGTAGQPPAPVQAAPQPAPPAQ